MLSYRDEYSPDARKLASWKNSPINTNIKPNSGLNQNRGRQKAVSPNTICNDEMGTSGKFLSISTDGHTISPNVAGGNLNRQGMLPTWKNSPIDTSTTNGLRQKSILNKNHKQQHQQQNRLADHFRNNKPPVGGTINGTVLAWHNSPVKRENSIRPGSLYRKWEVDQKLKDNLNHTPPNQPAMENLRHNHGFEGHSVSPTDYSSLFDDDEDHSFVDKAKGKGKPKAKAKGNDIYKDRDINKERDEDNTKDTISYQDYAMPTSSSAKETRPKVRFDSSTFPNFKRVLSDRDRRNELSVYDNDEHDGVDYSNIAGGYDNDIDSDRNANSRSNSTGSNNGDGAGNGNANAFSDKSDEDEMRSLDIIKFYAASIKDNHLVGNDSSGSSSSSNNGNSGSGRSNGIGSSGSGSRSGGSGSSSGGSSSSSSNGDSYSISRSRNYERGKDLSSMLPPPPSSPYSSSSSSYLENLLQYAADDLLRDTTDFLTEYHNGNSSRGGGSVYNGTGYNRSRFSGGVDGSVDDGVKGGVDDGIKCSVVDSDGGGDDGEKNVGGSGDDGAVSDDDGGNSPDCSSASDKASRYHLHSDRGILISSVNGNSYQYSNRNDNSVHTNISTRGKMRKSHISSNSRRSNKRNSKSSINIGSGSGYSAPVVAVDNPDVPKNPYDHNDQALFPTQRQVGMDALRRPTHRDSTSTSNSIGHRYDDPGDRSGNDNSSDYNGRTRPQPALCQLLFSRSKAPLPSATLSSLTNTTTSTLTNTTDSGNGGVISRGTITSNTAVTRTTVERREPQRETGNTHKGVCLTEDHPSQAHPEEDRNEAYTEIKVNSSIQSIQRQKMKTVVSSDSDTESVPEALVRSEIEPKLEIEQQSDVDIDDSQTRMQQLLVLLEDCLDKDPTLNDHLMVLCNAQLQLLHAKGNNEQGKGISQSSPRRDRETAEQLLATQLLYLLRKPIDGLTSSTLQKHDQIVREGMLPRL